MTGSDEVVTSLIRHSTEDEESFRHGLNVPSPVSVLVKGIEPLSAELLGDGPPAAAVAEEHAHEMTLLAGVPTIYEALAAMEDHQVVDEVDVAGLGLDLELSGLSDCLNCIEGLTLTGVQLGQCLGTRMRWAADEWGTTEVDDDPVIVVEQDGAAVESRPTASHNC